MHTNGTCYYLAMATRVAVTQALACVIPQRYATSTLVQAGHVGTKIDECFTTLVRPTEWTQAGE